MSEAIANTAPRFSTLADWLQWQETTSLAEIDLGLERCRKVAARLGVLSPSAPVITVAGTNGKGSSVAMLERIWLEQGYRVGAYTSPHMIEYNERIRYNGNPFDDNKICAAFERIEDVREGTPLTYFEYGTLAALIIFKDLDPDVIILEVGLGGRLDAVNIIDPTVALIARIGIDHVEYLGNDRESIGREKAGIMRSGKRAVCSDPNIPTSVVNYAKEIGASLMSLGVDYRYVDNGETWDWWAIDNQQYLDLIKPNLQGEYQLQNASGVLCAVTALQHELPVNRQAVESAFEKISLWGRFQRIPANETVGQIEYILDVAHNAQAIEQFVETLNSLAPAKKTHLVFGMLKSKDKQSTIRLLAPHVDDWYLASVNARRGAPAEELQAKLRECGVKQNTDCYASVREALEAATKSASDGHRILAIGSFLVVSEALRFLGMTQRSTIDV